MGSMLIRNIPDDVVERFKARARAEGKSAEQFAREALIEKAKPSREEILHEADRIRSMSKPVNLQTTMRIMEELRTEMEERGPKP